VLGTILGVAAKQFGRDKLTIVTSPGIYDLGEEFFRWEIATVVAGSIPPFTPSISQTCKRARSRRGN